MAGNLTMVPVKQKPPGGAERLLRPALKGAIFAVRRTKIWSKSTGTNVPLQAGEAPDLLSDNHPRFRQSPEPFAGVMAGGTREPRSRGRHSKAPHRSREQAGEQDDQIPIRIGFPRARHCKKTRMQLAASLWSFGSVFSKSNLEYKGAEMQRAVAIQPEVCPEYINPEAWATWVNYRRFDKRKAVTQRAAEMQWRALRELNPRQQRECIEHSIRNDYQGLFPEKFKHHSTHSTRTRTLYEDLNDRSWAT